MSMNWTMQRPLEPFILAEMKPATTTPPRRKSPPPASVGTRPVLLKQASADDDLLLCQCLEGISRQDQAALGELYDLTVSRVYSVALRIVRRVDLAEEVVSDVYTQVWREVNRYDATRAKVLGWLLVISRSRALDTLRRQDEAFSHPEPYDLVAEPESPAQNPEALLAAAEAGSALHLALATLNPLQRQLLALAFFRGLSHSEISGHLGLPLGTVKTHIRRALEVLRQKLSVTKTGEKG